MGLVEEWDTTKIQRYAPSTSLQRLFRDERYTTLIKEQLVLSVKSGSYILFVLLVSDLPGRIFWLVHYSALPTVSSGM